MEKRGQLFDQPFIMIFAIVVGALILVWEGKVIYDIVKLGDETEMQLFVNDFQEEVDKQYNYDLGSQKEVAMTLPKNLIEICFYDKDEGVNQKAGKELNTLINAAIKDNMIAFPLNAYKQTRFKIDKLKVKEKNPLCLGQGSKYVLFTGVDFVEIR